MPIDFRSRSTGIIGVGLVVIVACGEEPEVVPPPPDALSVRAEPPSHTFDERASILIESSRPATIYYTLDGTTVSSESLRYDAPIELTGDTLLSFIAVGHDGVWSAPGDEFYRKKPEEPPAMETPRRRLRVDSDVVFFSAPPRSSTRVEKEILLRSMGTDPVRIFGVDVVSGMVDSGPYSGEGIFEIVSGGEPRTLASGEWDKIVVSYSPTATLRAGTLEIVSDDERHDGAQRVELHGRMIDW